MKLLFLIGTGVAAPHIVQSWARAVKAMGYQTELLPLFQGQDVFSEIRKIKPDLSIALDHTGLPHKEMAEEGLFHCSWFVDHPLYFVKRQDFNPFHLAGVTDRTFLKTLKKLGCEKAFYCPLAYEAELFSLSKEWERKQDISLSFVGTFPGTYETLVGERKNKTDLFFNTVLDTAFHVKQKQAGWPLTDALEYVEQKGGAAFLERMSETQLSSLMMILDRESEAFVKTELARKFSDMDFRIYGNDLWKTLPEACSLFHGPIQYGKDLAGLYRRSKINVILTRAQLAEGVNQRVFDIPAAGGFFLCDYRRDLEDIFPEIWRSVTFRSLEELREKAEYYLSHPEERFEIADELHRCVREKHSYQARMREFLGSVKTYLS